MILTKGTVIASRYEIIDKLGSGGMAVVYLAKDLKLDRNVTFKVMRDEFNSDDDFKKRFNCEALAAAKLSHPNIVNVFDFGQEDLVNYIVMEYIHGINLKEFIIEHAPLDTTKILNISIQILYALQHSHNNNIVHRDIKPENILMTSSGEIKVTDFGIAHAITSSTVAVDNTIGSVYYFSPEQARGGYVDFKSDLYSLGIIMYEMCTGQLPYTGDSAVSVALKHINSELPDIKSINSKIIDSLIYIIQKSTQKISVNRYKNANDMIHDIQSISSDKNFCTSFDVTAYQTLNKTSKFDNKDLKKLGLSTSKIINDDLSTPNTLPDYVLTKKTEKNIILSSILISILIIFVITIIGLNNNKSDFEYVELIVTSGESSEDIINVANELGINIKYELSEYDNFVQEGKVLRADYYGLDPTKLQIGSTIGIVLSKGPEKIIVRDYTKKVIDDAIEMILEDNLIVGERIPKHDDNFAEGVVIAQNPSSASDVIKNTKIDLYYSIGPFVKKINVDNFIGLSEEDAIIKAKSSGLVVGNTTKLKSPQKEGTVLSQNLIAGREVNAGSTITFVISQQVDENVAPKSSHELVLDFEFPRNNDSIEVKIVSLSNSDMEETEIFKGLMTKNDMPFRQDVFGEETTNYKIYYLNGPNWELLAEKQLTFIEKD